MATLITKNSSTASSVPTAAQLVQGELAVNVTDKRLFTENASGTVVELGTNPSTLALPNGTANGVAYLNGSKVLTTGSALTFDGTNLGVGNTSPSSYDALARNLVVGGSGFYSGITIANTTNGAGSIFFADGTTSGNQYAGQIQYDHSINALIFGANAAEQMRLTSTGLGIGTSSPGQKLHVAGNIRTTNSLIEDTGTSVNFGTITAGYLAFLSGSGAERMRLDSSGNLGLGVTPSAWGYSAIQLKDARSIAIAGYSTGGTVSVNAYDNAGWKYAGTGAATRYQQNDGIHSWSTAPSGTAGNAISFTQSLTLDADRNLLLNGTSAGASSVGTFAIFNGTAPTGSVTNGIILYAEDVSSSSELKVRDEAGNVTTLSPHNFSLIPDGPSEDMAWAYYSEKGGKRINVDMLKLARMVEKLTGEKLVYES